MERCADWLVLATRLVLLRSRLLLPSTPATADAAQAEAERERSRLQDLQFVKAAAAWLEARPQLGRDVFPAPRRERDPRIASYMQLMEACLSVLERDLRKSEGEKEEVYCLATPALFRVTDALARIRRQLAGSDEPTPLMAFIPPLPDVVPDRQLLTRAAICSTLVAVLELARSTELVIGDDQRFECAVAYAGVSKGGLG